MKILSFILCIFLFLSGLAQENDDAFELSKEAWEELRSKEDYGDFKARKEIEEESSNISSQNFRNWEWWGLGISIIIIIVVVALVVRSQRGESRSLSNREIRYEAKSIEEAEENLPDLALNNLLEELKDNHDFRSALRVKFLMLLQALIDQKMVAWSRDKTNAAYLKELSEWEHQSAYQNICNLFDRTWYGHEEISELRFQQNDASIEALIDLIKPQNG